MKVRLSLGLSPVILLGAIGATLVVGVGSSRGARDVPTGHRRALVNTVSFTSSTATTAEGDSGTHNVNLGLTISPAAPPGGIVLNYTVTNGTATAGSDYSDPGSGSVTIPQNSSSFVIPITINGDAFKEADETFTVTLTGASQSYSAAGTDTATITNDDYQCGNPVVTPCWSAFQVDGGAPPAGLALQLLTSGSNYQVQLKYNNNLELSGGGGITSSNVVHMAINFGSYDPVVFGTTGQIQSFSETSGGSANTITLDVKPNPSSWRGTAPGCSVISCGSDINPVTADHDYTSLMLGFLSDLSTVNMSQSLKDAMHGTWLGTNAQAFSFPTFNNGTVNFTVAAPHFKTDGSTINTGFFQFFLPDALVVEMGVADPTAVSNGTFTVSNSNGGTVIFDVTHQSSPAGVLIKAGTNPPTLPTFQYSSPTFSVAKAATAPDAPTGVSATAGDGQATVSFSAPGSNGGAAITSYTVTASPGGATATGSSSPITISGLTNGTSYTFTVTALNSAGTGPASTASAAATPSAPAAPAAPFAPVVVTAQSGSTTDASITAGEAASITLTAPAGAPASTAPSIAWGSGTFTDNANLVAVVANTTSTSTPPALAGFSAGTVAVNLTFTSGDSTVRTFTDPLEIVFPDAPAGLAPGYSSDDGATWTAIPLLSGTTLPDGQRDGYYRDAAGAVHILTRHATYFGLLGELVLRAGNRPTFSVRSSRIFIYLAPGRKATAVVTLERRDGTPLKTLELSLPARTTKLKIPLPSGLAPGLYLVKVTATSGPAVAHATLRVRLRG